MPLRAPGSILTALLGCAAPPSRPTPAVPQSRAPTVATPTDPLGRPASATEAWIEELRYLEKLVDLWWATQAEHERIDALDVARVFADARHRVRACDALSCYATELNTTLCALGDGHLRLKAPWWLAQRHYQSEARFVLAQEGVVVARPAGPLTPGDRVIRIDGQPTHAYLAGTCERAGSTPGQRMHYAVQALSHRTRFGETNPEPLELELRTPGGSLREWTVKWSPPVAEQSDKVCVRGRVEDAKTSLLAIDTFWCHGNAVAFEQQLQIALAALGQPQRVIVDLRNNGGGMDGPARSLAAALVDRPTEWLRFAHPRPFRPAREFFREYVEPDPRWPELAHAEQWFLIGPGCFSTCDTFAAAMDARPGITFVGKPTAGGVGNPTEFRLPYTGIAVTIPVSLYAAPGAAANTLIEGRGVPPDIAIEPSATDIRNGRDVVFERALMQAPNTTGTVD